MRWAVVSCVALVLLWALSADWLARRRISGPMVMVTGGMALGLAGLLTSLMSDGVQDTIDLKILDAVLGGPTAQRVAELVLALLLFVDAFAIRRGFFGGYKRLSTRLLVIALPLSVALGLGLGLLLFPQMPWSVVLVLVCLVVPTDLAPTTGILRDSRIPDRVRDVLNVESGYNDGFIAPLFVFALTLAGSSSHASSPEAALQEAVPASLIAIVVGAALGALVGWVMKQVVRRGISSSHAVRFGIVGLPLLTYAVAMEAHGNGFVAAFVAGIAFRATRGEGAHREVLLAEEVATLAAYVMWFVMGVCASVVVVSLTSWQALVFGLAALTVVRIVPVLVSLIGSSMPHDERRLVALLGPRGIATIVFALLAFNDFGDAEAQILTLSVMSVTVVGSLLLHGIGAPIIADRYARKTGPGTRPLSTPPAAPAYDTH